MADLNKVAETLFDKIRSRFAPVELGDEKANKLSTDEASDGPGQARFFIFDYTSSDGRNFGTVEINLSDADNSLKVYFGRNITHEMTEEQQDEWFKFLEELKEFTRRNMLRSFDVHDLTRPALDVMSRRQLAATNSSYTANDLAPVTESQLYGSTKTSYQLVGPTKLIVKHSQKIDEEILGARTRKIESIFVETAEGERFKLPFTSLHGARAVARHIAEGGTVFDDISAHITETVKELGSMSCFVRAMQHRVFEDSETIKMVEAAKQRHTKLKKKLKAWSGPRGYASYFGDWSADSAPVSEVTDIDALRERFTKKLFDDRLMDALPYVQRAYQEFQMNETTMSQEFEQWADHVVEAIGAGPADDQDVQQLRNLFQTELIVGIDGEQAIAAVGQLIIDQTLHDNLYELSSIAGSSADARPVIYQWIKDNRPDLEDRMDYSLEKSTPAVVKQQTPMATTQQPKTEESIDFIRYLAGIKR